MTTRIVFLLILSFFLHAEAFAQIGKQSPAKLGYVYPAGGQRGTTFEIWVVGRQISRTTDAVFSSGGISANVVDMVWAWRNLDQRDRYMIRNRIGDAAARLVSDSPDGKLMKELIEKLPKVAKPPDPVEEIEAIPFLWQRGAVLRKLFEPDADVSMEEMQTIIFETYGPRMWMRAPDPLQEIVVLEVTIAPDAVPGDRELRLLTAAGLSNPLYFQVGIHPEANEREPNSPDTHGIADFMRRFERPVFDAPVVVNGQITHADIDRFSFRAKKGQPLVLQVQARQLMPFLADAVPGWFEAVVTVYDEKENELAFADRYRFDADPVLLFDPPADGVYTAEVRDSLFRGREDFVYRLSIAPTPLVESVFPLGLKEGTSATLRLTGRNLAAGEVKIDSPPGPDNIRTISQIGSQWLPRPIRYQVDTLPEAMEAADNHSREKAQTLTLPVIVNGKISKPGEYDYYRFDGKEGESLVFEVTARRLDSLLDSRLALLDASGKIIAENDDGGTVEPDNRYLSKLFGTQTHNADSKLAVTLPSTGPFFVRIGDTARHGGDAYGYRLRLSKPRPEFDVFMTPSAATLFAGNCDMVWFYVDRKDGYQGPVELKPLGDTQGFGLDGGLIQAGENSVVCTLTTPPDPLRKAIPLRFEAVAAQDGQTVRRAVLPVDDMEQAFLYHHWVPAENFWVLMTSRRGGTGFRPVKNEPIRLKPGEKIDVEYETTLSPTSATVFWLRDAPPGVWCGKKSQEGKKLVLTFACAPDCLQKAAEKEYAAKNPPVPTGDAKEKKEETPKPAIEPKKSLAGNFLVVVEGETTPKKPEEKKTRYPLGMLPAIPYRIAP